jgi:predicted dehydrogenase
VDVAADATEIDVMTLPIRWGLLSTALINRKLIAGARVAKGVEVAAVASRDLARARVYADEHEIPMAYGSYDELLADADIDAVYIPLPNALHHQWTLRALRAGKHVLCEKPYSRHPADITEAFDLAERSGLVLSEAYMWRYHPQTTTLVQLVQDGVIGELRLISASFTWPCDAPGDIRLDPTLDGGALLDVGCYCVSAARLLAGEPDAVMAQQVPSASGVDALLTGQLRFPSSVLATFDCGLRVPDRSSLEVMGTEGTIVVSDPWHCLEPGLEVRMHAKPHERVPVPRANSYALELEAMGGAIRGDQTVLLGREDAVGQARTLAALLEASAEAGRPIGP